MPLSIITAHCVVESMAPYTQSRNYSHEVEKLEGESPGDYDKRNWREHLHVRNGTVHVPARAMCDSLIDAAKYTKKKIMGQGNATWTAKFASGMTILEDIDLGIKPEDVSSIDIWANSDGIRGSAKRVMRRLPVISEWRAEFDITILDPIITEDILEEMLETAGLFIGIGQNRPQNRGTSGRFRLVSIDWQEDRQPKRRAKLAA